MGHRDGCQLLDEGPEQLFLLCWLGSVGLAAAAIACFVTARAGRVMRWEGFRWRAWVPLGAAVWFIVVVVDGIEECGF